MTQFGVAAAINVAASRVGGSRSAYIIVMGPSQSAEVAITVSLHFA